MDALLGPLLALARAGISSGQAAAGRISIGAFCGVLAGIAATAAVGCGMAALWIVVLPNLGPAGAALLLAGLLAILFLALLTLTWAIVWRDRRRPHLTVGGEEALLAMARLFGEHKGAVLLAALVAGLAAGSNGRKR
jgi:hypothetical protein